MDPCRIDGFLRRRRLEWVEPRQLSVCVAYSGQDPVRMLLTWADAEGTNAVNEDKAKLNPKRTKPCRLIALSCNAGNKE